MTDIFEDDDQEWQPETRWRKSHRNITTVVAGAVAFFILAMFVVVNAFSGIATSSANQTLDSFNASTKGLYQIVNADGAADELNQTYADLTGEAKTNVGYARQVADGIRKKKFQPLEKGLPAKESAERVTLYFSLCDLMNDIPTTNTNITTINLVETCGVYKNRVNDLTEKFSNYDFMRKFRFMVPPFVADMSKPMPALFYKE